LFTYKKYRFYFGIFTSCNHSYDKCLPLPNNSWKYDSTPPVDYGDSIKYYQYREQKRECTVPSPFVMSDNRRACVMHQKIIFKDITSRSDTPPLNVPSKVEFTQRHKFYHSEECFKSWINKKSKSNYSHRTGISYNTRIRANGEKFLLSNNNGRHMYKKEFYNFNIGLNYKASTLKKQQQRRESRQRRIFKDDLKEPLLDPNYRLLKARQKNFLFTPEQSLRKRILHLKYTKHPTNVHILVPKDYPYRVPYFYFNRNTKSDIHNTALYG
jgi:hypothetical protein